MNIAVIGFRGTGKTTVCRLLSERLGYKLISTDEEIIKYTKMPIQGFIKKFGWDKFRDRETEVVEKICDYDDCIFDTGGGLVMRNENIVSLKKCSVIVLLT
ncbi:MAG TPA: shikimate kinase, partial [Candidatus Nanoarchaeia archaeon]|nr:shikimate kinase [Candidatus Nanoarchaeia archaeon]